MITPQQYRDGAQRPAKAAGRRGTGEQTPERANGPQKAAKGRFSENPKVALPGAIRERFVVEERRNAAAEPYFVLFDTETGRPVEGVTPRRQAHALEYADLLNFLIRQPIRTLRKRRVKALGHDLILVKRALALREDEPTEAKAG